MKILDDRSRLFGIVNPVDLVAIIALLVAALAIANVLFGVKAATVQSSTGTVRAVVFVGAVRNFVPDSLKAGDPVNRKGGGPMGKVVSVRLTPSTSEQITPAGTLTTTRSKALIDLYVTVEGPGTITPVAANIGDEQLRSNQSIDIQTPMFEATGARVNAIEKVR